MPEQQDQQQKHLHHREHRHHSFSNPTSESGDMIYK